MGGQPVERIGATRGNIEIEDRHYSDRRTLL